MRTITVAGALLLSATAAQAQVVVKPVEPRCVDSADIRSFYIADIETDYDFWFHLEVVHDGVVKHDSLTYVVNAGPTYRISQAIDHTGWNMRPGRVITYRGNATIANGPHEGRYDEKDWLVRIMKACRACERNERACHTRAR